MTRRRTRGRQAQARVKLNTETSVMRFNSETTGRKSAKAQKCTVVDEGLCQRYREAACCVGARRRVVVALGQA